MYEEKSGNPVSESIRHTRQIFGTGFRKKGVGIGRTCSKKRRRSFSDVKVEAKEVAGVAESVKSEKSSTTTDPAADRGLKRDASAANIRYPFYETPISAEQELVE
jgi:hypothetical protein